MRVCHLTVLSKLGMLGGMVLGLAFSQLPLAAQKKAEQGKQDSKKGVGLVLSGDVTEQDLGLPIYPGARKYKDQSDSSSAVQMGLRGGSSSFKLAVLKLESDDPPAKVADFYRRALGRIRPRSGVCEASGQDRKAGCRLQRTDLRRRRCGGEGLHAESRHQREAARGRGQACR